MIDVAHHGPIAIVTLRRAPVNAMNLEFTEEIATVFQRLGQDRSVRSAILTGEGKSFCAGVDLKALPSFDQAYQRRMVDALNRAFYAVYSCPVPVVGAINGHAIAGGLVLALCCDWRIAAKTEFLAGLAEVRVGVPYPVAAMEVVRQELRPDVARQLVLFGQDMSAAAAVQAGVFDDMVDPEALLERALAKANEFTALPQMAFARSKRQLRSRACEAIEAAIAGAEPLLDGWLRNDPGGCRGARPQGLRDRKTVGSSAASVHFQPQGRDAAKVRSLQAAWLVLSSGRRLFEPERGLAITWRQLLLRHHDRGAAAKSGFHGLRHGSAFDWFGFAASSSTGGCIHYAGRTFCGTSRTGEARCGFLSAANGPAILNSMCPGAELKYERRKSQQQYRPERDCGTETTPASQ